MTSMKEKAVARRAEYILRLERGEDVLPILTDFCIQKGIASGSFTAIGALKNAKIGYYDLVAKQYGSKHYPEEMEVASMTGNIALVDSKPFIHAHAVLSGIREGSENQCVGGHVFEAAVAVTLEVHLVAYEGSVTRAYDAEIGLKLLDL